MHATPRRLDALLVLAAALVLLGGCRDRQVLVALPDASSDELVASLQEWVVWPDEQFIAEHLARRDRSAEFPPLYPETDIEDPKPLRPGAEPPETAVAHSAMWIRMVLKPEWVPGDLEQKLVPLQLDPASRSVVLCRWEMRGNRFQIAQSYAGLCIVLEPANTGAPGDAGPKALRAFLAHGAEMADLPATTLPVSAEGVHAFVPDRDAWPLDAYRYWWGWRLWYTNGEAVAVFMHKVADSQHPPQPDEPWF
ncbi:MAG: hypothetical protein AB7Y46_18770 [Armatimonadota bacterium]